jgi:hypothetical protein
MPGNKQTMTKQQLLRELRKCPPDALIFVRDGIKPNRGIKNVAWTGGTEGAHPVIRLHPAK